ncbi:MAG: TrkA C-terminal domain-containing protein [Actinomycetaceae bacterium]|nr:TrkA C-terminal domain-containing protein [Actinomycetaceae bacterium]
MFDILSQSAILTFFLVVALGAAFGQVKFGHLKFGAAGALFVGLAFSAAYPELGEGMSLMQTIGLALFTYTVGVAAGATFMQQMKSQATLVGAAALMTLVAGIVTVVGGKLLQIPAELATGLFTGALTSAPALDSALRVTGSATPGAGYAVGYPFGVIVGIIIVTIVVERPWKGEKDTPSLAGAGLLARTAHVQREINLREVGPWAREDVRMSYLRRGDKTRVIVPGEELYPDDLVVVVGEESSVLETIDILGYESSVHIADDRRAVDFEKIRVSNSDMAGRSIAELNVPVRFGAIVTRVSRGDLELLAKDELILQPGDEVSVAVPSNQLQAVRKFFGDSDRRVAEVDALTFGLGMVLGLLVGLVSIPMPGGAMFSLGAAAGPLVVGMVLGALRRTGTLIWSMPESVNLTIRQLGLLFFLAALGLGAGPAFKEVVVTSLGWKAAIVSTAIAVFSAGALAISGRFLKLSGPRTAGGVAGFLGQPAIMQAAAAKVADERIESAYAALFASAIVFKILIVPVIYMLLV